MADELSDYLQGGYLDEKRDTSRILGICSSLLGVFDRLFLSEHDEWAYEAIDGDLLSEPKTFSFSTNSMILFALAGATGGVSLSELLPRVPLGRFVQEDPDLSPRLETKMTAAFSRFPGEVRAQGKSRKASSKVAKAPRQLGRRTIVTESASFGPNDPLTLTWLLELTGAEAPFRAKDRDDIRATLLPIAKDVVLAANKQPSVSPLQVPHSDMVPHAFPLLRVLHLSRTISRVGGRRWSPSLDNIYEYLLSRAHFHLSSASLESGGFDAAELAFSLEGVLLGDLSSPDLGLLGKGLEVLAARQLDNPYWRPLRPFRVTSQGMILLPQSVEIANSLLRLCRHLDQIGDRSYFSEYIDLFKAYTRWLEARMIVGRTKSGIEFRGWQSEHTFAPRRIHLWQTSQVLLYLVHYATMLQLHVARSSLRSARFSQESFAPGTKSNGRLGFTRWEPLSSLSRSSTYSVLERLWVRIVEPRLKRTPAMTDSSAVLLYGPPGTGKSTVAREIAETLGNTFITITPSDFIAAGQEAVEARAKNIFATLREQSNIVVLFDEVDQLLLDRKSQLYMDQNDIFKLITPGMLTKIADLAKRKQVVFLIATNYLERIDPAIRRQGRIDDKLLLLPPDARQRARFMARGRENGRPQVAEWGTASETARKEFVRRTALATYAELSGLARTINEARVGQVSIDSLLERHGSDFHPDISIESYRGRVLDDEGVDDQSEVGSVKPDGPLDEFVMVVYLACEEQRLDKGDRPWVSEVVRYARDNGRVSIEEKRVWRVLRAAGIDVENQ